MHIHGVSFYVFDRNGVPVAPEEAGAKDVLVEGRDRAHTYASTTPRMDTLTCTIATT